MTAEEILRALLANQRHEFLDRDPDSQHECTDRQLCEHGRPLVRAHAECPDCNRVAAVLHAADYETMTTEHIMFCRRCGRTSGVHGRRKDYS